MTNTDPGAPAYEYDWQNPDSQKFDFGRVFGRSFTGIFANLRPLMIAFLIAIAITIVASIISSDQMRGFLGDGTIEEITAASTNPIYWLFIFLTALPGLLLTFWFQLVVIQTSYSDFTKTSYQGAPLKTAARFILPMFVIALIYIVVCGLGWSFFFIGFFFIWPGWALAGPILVFEKKGIFGSLGEAWNLSRGSKRWIFLLLFLLSIIGLIIYSVGIGIGFLATGINAFGGDTTSTLNMSIGQQVIYNVVFGIVGYFVYAIFASGLTAAYVEIKTMKGGVASVSEIFN